MKNYLKNGHPVSVQAWRPYRYKKNNMIFFNQSQNMEFRNSLGCFVVLSNHLNTNNRKSPELHANHYQIHCSPFRT